MAAQWWPPTTARPLWPGRGRRVAPAPRPVRKRGGAVELRRTAPARGGRRRSARGWPALGWRVARP
eukprot:8086782-Lingulodinium_polyedra.AAC.1